MAFSRPILRWVSSSKTDSRDFHHAWPSSIFSYGASDVSHYISKDVPTEKMTLSAPRISMVNKRALVLKLPDVVTKMFFIQSSPIRYVRYMMEVIIIRLLHRSLIHFAPILGVLVGSPDMHRLQSTLSFWCREIQDSHQDVQQWFEHQGIYQTHRPELSPEHVLSIAHGTDMSLP